MGKKKRSKQPKLQPERKSQFSRFIESISENKPVLWLTAALALLALFLYYPNHFGDYDIWWHIKYGEQFIANKTMAIDHTQFSWTESDGSWKYVTWIGSILLYLIHKAGGYAGLHIMQYCVLLFMGVLLFFFSRIRGTTFGAAHIGALLLAWAAMNPTAIFIKPEQFTIVLFALAVFIYFSGKTKDARLFYVYPPLFLIWVNTHGAFLIGLIFISAVLVLETINRFLVKRNELNGETWRTLLISVVLSYAATLINPYGPAYVIETVARLASGGGGMSELMAYTERWKHLFPASYAFRRTNTAWALVIMEAAAIIVFIRSLRSGKKLDITLIGLNLLFFMFAMTMSRAILYFPAVWIFSLFFLFDDDSSSSFTNFAHANGVILTIALGAVIMYNTAFQNIYSSWFGSKVDEFTPGKAIATLKKANFPGPVFNDYLNGGYMIYAAYPQYKVFIDPRHRPFESTGVWDDFVNVRRNNSGIVLNNFMKKYQFKTALIHHLSYGNLALLFLRSTEWRLVYFDTIACIFIHASIQNQIDKSFTDEHLDVTRFEHVNNPAILTSLFQIYTNSSIENTEKIMEYFSKNVSGRYIRKAEVLARMQSFIAQMKSMQNGKNR